MTTSNLLKWSIEFLFWAILGIGVAIILFVLISVTFGDSFGMFITEDGTPMITHWYSEMNEAYTFKMKDYLVLIFGFSRIIIFIGSIYYLRRASLKIIKNHMFSEDVVQALKRTGQLIISYSILMIISQKIIEVLYKGSMSFGVDFEGFGSSLFLFILGLFFVLISNAFEAAGILKSENELTI